jgi:hypothetical protein
MVWCGYHSLSTPVVVTQTVSDSPSRNGPRMARIVIIKHNGSASNYFWSDTDQAAPTAKTVYKQTADGVKRMKGVHYDSTANRMVKH